MDELEVLYTVVEVERRTSTIVEVCLSPHAQRIEFLPGQYVLLEDAGRGLPPRSYSIANAPRDDGLLSLLVTRVPDGRVSRWAYDRTRVGDEVTLSGPYGTFVADQSHAGPRLYLAAGSGLAPIRALVEEALSGAPQLFSTLVFSARTEADVLDRSRFARLAATHPRFRFIRTLTRGSGPPPHGRIPTILSDLCGSLAGQEVFIAGAPGFVRACASVSEQLGARTGHVHTEVFFVEGPGV
jgi:CDP-4-dehydro-6-deoxyglucose reductase, E3